MQVEQDAESDDKREHKQEIEQIHQMSEMQLERKQAPADRATKEAAFQATDAKAQDAAVAAAHVAFASTTSSPRGNNGVDTDLFARYRAAVREGILRNWTRPGWMPVGQRCKLVINQIPGGDVTEVQVDPSCPYDELDRRSLEAAVLQAQSLPYSGFEAVFQNVLILDFEAPDQ